MVSATREKILVWDLPTRLGHWLLAAAFAVAWLTGESESWRLLHVAAGALMGAIVLFRLLWGIVGSRHARFASFAAAPRAAFVYLRELVRGCAPHFAGHNPAAAWAIFALLALIVVVAASGWCAYASVAGQVSEELHEAAANALLLVVALHLAGVVAGSLAHRENLARAMLSGRKLGLRSEAIASAHPGAALLLAAWAAAAVWGSRYL